MKAILITTAFLLLASVRAEDVRLVDLEPTDAQQLIENKDASLKYAPKIDSNVPAVRFLGNEPHNVLEDIYLANQYHGQDGLGGYLYGYSVPDIAKTERKQAGGDLRGAYNYIAGNGQEIKVEYWDDGTGFHQVDNVPKVLPQQIEDLPEVKAARDEHFRRWQEEAERNSHPVTVPPSHYTPQRAQNQFQPQKYPGFGQSQGSAQGFAQQYSSQQGQGFGQQNQGFAQQGQQAFGQQSKSFGQSQGFGQNQGFGQAQAQGFSQTAPQQYSGASASQSSFQTSAFGQGAAHQQGSGFGQGQIGFAASAPAVATAKASGPVSTPGYNQQASFAQSTGFNQAQGSAPLPLSHPASSQNVGGQGYGQQQAQGSASVPQAHLAPSQSSAGQGYGQQQAQGSVSAPQSHPAPSQSLGGQGYGQQHIQGSASAPQPLAAPPQNLGGQGYGPQAQGSSPVSVSTSQHAFQSQQTNPNQGSQPVASGSYQQTTQIKTNQYGSQGYRQQGQGSQGEDDSGEYKGHDDEGQYKPESEEEQGPPKGFFYNFDYPVGIIVQKLGKVGGGGAGGAVGFEPHSQQKRESLQEIYEKNKANFQASLGTGSGTQSGYVAY